MEYKKNGAAYINSLIKKKTAEGCREITVSGNYETEDTIILPSGVTLVLKDCRLRMADGTFCQMFRNEGAVHENVFDSDIHLRGEGTAVLDGGNYNGLSERNALTGGRPHIIVNNILTFVRINNLSVSGIEVKNMRWWALNFIACSYGHLHDICFASDATVIDPVSGERLYGFGNRKYEDIYIKNSDGIDLRLGCHHFLIENITGFTEDDTVALTALESSIENFYPFPESAEHSIHDVTVKNIRAAALCGIVRLLNQGGTSLYNITVDGVYDTSAGDDRLIRGNRGVLVGDRKLYGDYYPSENDTYNITLKNIEARADIVLKIYGKIKNLTVENINGFDGFGKITERIE